jgi:hypothetical protein
MDGARFDAITVRLVRGATRRRAVSSVGAAGLGLLLAARTDRSARAACQPLQASCGTPANCCQDGGPATCAPNAHGAGIRTRCGLPFLAHCCRPLHGVCGDDCDCCGGLTCRNGRCGGPCHDLGAACVTSAECCVRTDLRSGRRMALRCRPTARGTGLEQRCGSPAQTWCCLPPGAPCADDCDCCAGTDCFAGVCQCPANEVQCGDDCIPLDDCCPDGRYCRNRSLHPEKCASAGRASAPPG